MTRKPSFHLSARQGRTAIRVRTDLRAGGLSYCMAYCDQERARCYNDPSVPTTTCDDRYPICQNACTVCGMTPY